MADSCSENTPLLDQDKASPPLDKGPRCFSARYLLAFLAFLGFFNVYCMRVNLSVALVAMVRFHNSSDNASSAQECPSPHNDNASSSASTGEFDWDENTQGLILGAFFYGYITTQLPGGWLAEQVGGKRLFGLGILCTAVLTLLTPVAARLSLGALIALRVLEGIGEGVTFPAMHALWGNWAPVSERSRLVSFTYAGSQLGTVFAIPISGLLCDYGFAGGWPSVFYVFGAVGCVWVAVWMLAVHDHPHQHPRISVQERLYIESSIGVRQKVSTPWRSIFTSGPMWAICAAHFANNWGFYSMLTCLPLYMKRILKFDLQQSGFLSSLPYLVLWIMQTSSGFIADFLRGRQLLSTCNARKLLNSIGLMVPGVLLVGASYAGCDHLSAVTLLTLGLGFGGLCMGGFNCNHLDIAPRFAGTLLGITNAVATIPGFLGPQLVGVLTKGHDTMGQWRIFFYITAGVYVAGTVIFIVLGQGSEQKWARSAASSSDVPRPADVCGSVNSASVQDGERESLLRKREPESLS